LERYGEKMKTCSIARQQNRLFLEFAVAALRAETAFLWSATETFQIAGPRPMDEGWCHRLLTDLLDESPGTDSQLLRSFIKRPRVTEDNMIASVALVRLSKTRDTWAGVLSFDVKSCFSPTDMNALLVARHLLRLRRRTQQIEDRLRGSIYGLVTSLATAADMCGNTEQDHSKRVARLAARLGEELELGPEIVADLHLVGLLHDVGKTQLKPTPLHHQDPATDGGEAYLRRLSMCGASIVENIGQLAYLAPSIRHQHERWDGRGCPDGLAGDKIPLMARIVAVADAFDVAAAGNRSRGARTPAQVEKMLVDGCGLKWDPKVVASMRSCQDDLYELRCGEAT
jgi:HD-GYP domain-containing protein (c-di-GMP phosphodiesterase class II)